MRRITTSQAAYLMGVDKRTVCGWADKGVLSAERDYRGWRWFDEDEVLALRKEDPRTVPLPPSPKVMQSPVRVRRKFDLEDTGEL